MQAICPQFDMDGQKNVWIVKPGSKSRGRGMLPPFHGFPIEERIKTIFFVNFFKA